MKRDYLTIVCGKENAFSLQKGLMALLLFFSLSFAYAQQTATIVTTSNDANWTATFQNVGGLSLSWVAIGPGINENGTSDTVNFDFSSNVGNNPITITVTSLDNFNFTTRVWAPARDIVSIDLSNLNNLEQIELPNNLLTNLDLSQNTQLKILGMENNALTSIDLSANTLLERVEVQTNDLTGLDVSSSPLLNYLDANNNDISSLNVAGNPNLTFLDMSSNDLTTIDVSGNSALELLNLDFNLLPTAVIGQVLIDVNAHGTSDGELGLQGNPGTIPAGSIPAYDALLSRNWTIRPPVIYDFGDARGYGTALGANGPLHIVGIRDIKLGSIVDSETNVNPNVDATTDDTTNLDDEDALEASDFVGIQTSSDSFSVDIDYTNNFTAGATIYAWLDFDINGNFDADEFTSVPVPNGGFGTVTLTWSDLIANGVDINGGLTSARFRITTDVLAPNQTGGVATDGEVEDYGNIEIELDTDKDGIVDSIDVDDDNDGILDTVEDNGVVDRDTDGDGDPDRIDLDADGDNCFDVIEAGFADGDGDGELGTAPLTVDANGQVTGQGGYTLPNDLDGNGTPDFQEAGAVAVITTEPTDQELIIGDVTFSVVADADSYQWQESTDGGANWTDIVDGGDYAGATTADLVVTNSDISKLTYRYRVIVDYVSFACAEEVTSVDVGFIIPDDFDGDGVYDIVDVDDDNDGILDTEEDNGVVDRDTDGDGNPDRIDWDSDDDGCYDVTEAGFTDNGMGMLGTTVPPTVDANGQVTSATDGYTAPNDLDNNGTPDFQEAGEAASITTQPTDQDLVPGASATFSVVAVADTFQWEESTDGGANWSAVADGGNYSGATTADLTISNLDVSMVGYLYRAIVSNVAFACDPTTVSNAAGFIQLDDTDNDGVPDLVDVDDDNDGIFDTVEDNGVTDRDTDGNGVPDRIQLDSDGDGCYDVTEAGFTDNGMGMLGTVAPPLVDANGQVTSATDGYTTPNDLDGNGTPDFQEAGEGASISTDPVDQDFILNGSAVFTVSADGDAFQWQVSTNGSTWMDLADGGNYSGVNTSTLTVSDLVISIYGESYRVIVTRLAYACDPGAVSASATYNVLDDTDEDGVYDIVDVDDDNDGILDSVEGEDTDSNNDGTPDRISLDADGDGCFDVTEAGFDDPDGDGILGTSPVTVDADGQVTGQGGYTTPNDLNGNGVYDFQEAGSASVISDQPVDVTIALGQDAVFQVNGSATYYQWQESADGSTWVDLVNGADYMGVDTQTMTVVDARGKLEGNRYRVVLRSPDFACDPNPELISEDVRLIFNTSLIPSGFSPNGDGENDVFLIPGLREFPNFTMEVFDRWGNSVYKYDNNGSPNLVWWDGRSTGNMTLSKGELVPAGTYFYHIEYNGGGKSADTGWVYVNY